MGFNEELKGLFQDVFGDNIKQTVMSSSLNGKVVVIYGNNGCVDRDTEYFNGTEWKKICDYVVGEKVLQYNIETKEASLVEPIRYIKLPEDKMYHFETKYGLNQTLSGDHRVIYESRKGKLYICTMEEMKQRHESRQDGLCGRFLTTFDYNGKGLDLTDDEIRLRLAVMVDGHFPKDINTTRCRIRLKKERKQERLEMLLNNLGIEYKKRYEESTGFNIYSFYADNREKEFKSYWYEASKHQMEVIVEEITKWDGYESRGRRGYCSTNKCDVDFIQFACACCGLRGAITEDNRVDEQITGKKEGCCHRKVCYNLSITDKIKPLLGGFNKKRAEMPKIEEVKTKDGFKYCFTVPTSALVLRREGKVFVTGNCGKTKQISRLTPNTVFLACENGLSGINNCLQMKIKSWSDFTSSIKKLENKKLVEQLETQEITVCIDGYENLAEYCAAYICSQYGADSLGSGNNGYGLFKEYLQELNKQMTRLYNIGYFVVITCHPKELKDKKGNFAKYELNLDTRARKVVCDNADVVAYVENNGVDENGKPLKSSAYFVETEDFFARCRYDHMVPMLEQFTAENFRKALSDAVKKQLEDEGAEDHTSTEIKEMYDKKELTHEELIEAIKKIFIEDIQDNENLEEKYAEIIERHLGQVLVSETNYKHDEALKCVLNDLEELVR